VQRLFLVTAPLSLEVGVGRYHHRGRGGGGGAATAAAAQAAAQGLALSIAQKAREAHATGAASDWEAVRGLLGSGGVAWIDPQVSPFLGWIGSRCLGHCVHGAPMAALSLSLSQQVAAAQVRRDVDLLEERAIGLAPQRSPSSSQRSPSGSVPAARLSSIDQLDEREAFAEKYLKAGRITIFSTSATCHLRNISSIRTETGILD
jgi:hypothetical protein